MTNDEDPPPRPSALAKQIFTMAPPKKKKAKRDKSEPLAPPPPKKKKEAKKDIFDPFISTLQEYHDGIQSVQEIVKLSRAYQGPNRHLLWDGRGNKSAMRHLSKCYIDACFSLLPEEKMIELIRAMVAADPEFCSIEAPPYSGGVRRTFLSVALHCARRKAQSRLDPNSGNTSFAVLQLLAVKGVTQIKTGPDRCTPLLMASQISGLDPAVLHHLMELDPEALLVADPGNFYRPLHYALTLWTPSTDSVVSRMVELAPSSLVCNGLYGPVIHAMASRGESPELSRRLRDLVEEHPLSAQPGVVSPCGTALFLACHRSAHDRGLVEAVLRTYPPALCLAYVDWHEDGAGDSLLPCEAAARYSGVDEATVRYLKDETLHMTLAAVEYAIASFDPAVDDVNAPAVARGAAAEQDHSDTDDDEADGLDDSDADEGGDSSADDESDSTYKDVDSQNVDASEDDCYEYDDDTADLVDNGAYDDVHPSVEFDSACAVADSHDAEPPADLCGNRNDDDSADLNSPDPYDNSDSYGDDGFRSTYTHSASYVAGVAKDRYKFDWAARFAYDEYESDGIDYMDDDVDARGPYMDDGSVHGDYSDNDGYSSENSDTRRQAEEAAAAARRPDDFRRRVQSTVSGAVRPAELSLLRRASGFAWTQALLKLENCLDLCRELFACPTTAFALDIDTAFREAVLGDAVLNLYRMNQLGGRSDPSPHHQARLLALVSDNLESVYLQFREFGAFYLVVGNSGVPHE